MLAMSQDTAFSAVAFDADIHRKGDCSTHSSVMQKHDQDDERDRRSGQPNKNEHAPSFRLWLSDPHRTAAVDLKHRSGRESRPACSRQSRYSHQCEPISLVSRRLTPILEAVALDC
jgi:hypothetical protein